MKKYTSTNTKLLDDDEYLINGGKSGILKDRWMIKKYTIYVLGAESNSSWIEWYKAGEANTIEEANEVASKSGWTIYGIRLSSDPKPRYLSPDKLWVKDDPIRLR